LETARRYGTRWLGKLEAMETADAFAREAVRWSWGRISTDGLLGAAAAWQASPPASEALTPPLLMMMSSGSPMAPEMERIARAGGPERRIFIRDAGGAAPLHRPEATARALREFLRDVEGGRPISGEWEI
jgi:pimeloyl-ACP methyl ester carboxylesterase